MKKLVGILVSASLIVTAGVPAFAAEETETVAASAEETETLAVSAEETETTGEEYEIHYIDDLSLELSYDDRYDLSNLDESISPDEEYVIFQTVYEEGQGITSYQVSQGTRTDEEDEALLTLKGTGESDVADMEGNTEVIATGAGSGTVWLVRADQEEDLRKALEKDAEPDTEPGPEDPDGDNPDGDNPDGDNPDGDNPDGDNPDGDNPDGDEPKEIIDVYEIAVTVTPAPLTVMLLAGQSNMEGYCSSNTGYDRGDTIACEEGAVYSTYVPWSSSIGSDITGISFGELCTTSNYNNTAGDFVAGSLQGTVTEEGVFCDPSNMSGGALEYSLNSLTSAGDGKTGPDSGLAYEWNCRTGDKVWVVNAAYGATSISRWVPGADCYERMMSVWQNVRKTYEAEIAAGHYTAGETLMFWLQGEADRTWDAAKYEEEFAKLYDGCMTQADPDGIGIIMVRASNGSYQNEEELEMTGPRIAQYWLGSGNSPYDNVFVVSNANEQWVSDAGVEAYFQSRYGSALSYPTRNGSASVPTTVNEVHYDIHYSQIGHNENGITAADGMVEALFGSSAPESVSWRDATGQTVSSLLLELVTDTAIAEPVADPVYTAKQLTWDSLSGSVILYDAATGMVQAASDLAIGTEDLAAYVGNEIVSLPVTVSTPLDLSGIAGTDYNGLFYYNGIWWYLEDGIIQPEYEGPAENEDGLWYVKNGRIDYTYTGFGKNEDGCWYFENGEVTFETNGVIKDSTGAIGEEGTWYYVVGSEVQIDFTGLADYRNENGWWYIRNGVVDFTANTVARNVNGWYYVKDGQVDFSYTGFAENENGWWYIEGGQVTFQKNEILEDTNGVIGEPGVLYYVVESKVQLDYTGLADYESEGDWWYIRDGVVDFTANTVARNVNGWFYVKDGKIDFSYNGFAENENGTWYIDSGQVTFEKNEILEDTTGAIGEPGVRYYVVGSNVQLDYTGLADYESEDGWWYITDGVVDVSYTGFAEHDKEAWYVDDGRVTFEKNGVLEDTTGAIGETGVLYYVTDSKVQDDFTGLADYKYDGVWWYFKGGRVDLTANTVAKNKNGWFYVKDGQVDFSYIGFAENSNGRWYCEEGKVTFNQNSVIKDTTGAIGTEGIWYYVVGSKVQTDFTGLADYKNANGWWYIQNGQVDFSANTVAKNKNGWFYVLDGKVQFGFTGLADYRNDNGWWYIQGGQVDFSANTVARNKNGWFYVLDGKVQFDFTGLADYRNDYGWWYIKDGQVDFSYTGIAQNHNGWFYVEGGKVDFTYTGSLVEGI